MKPESSVACVFNGEARKWQFLVCQLSVKDDIFEDSVWARVPQSLDPTGDEADYFRAAASQEFCKEYGFRTWQVKMISSTRQDQRPEDGIELTYNSRWSDMGIALRTLEAQSGGGVALDLLSVHGRAKTCVESTPEITAGGQRRRRRASMSEPEGDVDPCPPRAAPPVGRARGKSIDWKSLRRQISERSRGRARPRANSFGNVLPKMRGDLRQRLCKSVSPNAAAAAARVSWTTSIAASSGREGEPVPPPPPERRVSEPVLRTGNRNPGASRPPLSMITGSVLPNNGKGLFSKIKMRNSWKSRKRSRHASSLEASIALETGPLPPKRRAPPSGAPAVQAQQGEPAERGRGAPPPEQQQAPEPAPSRPRSKKPRRPRLRLNAAGQKSLRKRSAKMRRPKRKKNRKRARTPTRKDGRLHSSAMMGQRSKKRVPKLRLKMPKVGLQLKPSLERRRSKPATPADSRGPTPAAPPPDLARIQRQVRSGYESMKSAKPRLLSDHFGVKANKWRTSLNRQGVFLAPSAPAPPAFLQTERPRHSMPARLFRPLLSKTHSTPAPLAKRAPRLWAKPPAPPSPPAGDEYECNDDTMSLGALGDAAAERPYASPAHRFSWAKDPKPQELRRQLSAPMRGTDDFDEFSDLKPKPLPPKTRALMVLCRYVIQEIAEIIYEYATIQHNWDMGTWEKVCFLERPKPEFTENGLTVEFSGDGGSLLCDPVVKAPCRISFELKQLRGFLLVGIVALPTTICPRKHQLSKRVLDEPLLCSECLQEMLPRATVFGCHQCKWNKCVECNGGEELRNFTIIDDFNTVAFGVDKNKDMLIMGRETRFTALTISENDFIEFMVLSDTIRVYHNENMVEERPNFLDPDKIWRFGMTTGQNSKVKIVDLVYR